MKNTLMLVIVIAGILTATYRFLPAESQQQINAQLNKVAQKDSLLPIATASPEPKKYTLVIPDSDADIKTKAKTSSPEKLQVSSAYIQHLEDVRVQDEGRLVKVLPDDRDGSKHQRFIVKTPEGISVLIAHNIDLAPRIKNLTIGDTLYFSGEYVWNEKGGVVHWTHRDPNGRHMSGWIKHDGVTYQ